MDYGRIVNSLPRTHSPSHHRVSAAEGDLRTGEAQRVELRHQQRIGALEHELGERHQQHPADLHSSWFTYRIEMVQPEIRTTPTGPETLNF